MQNLGARSLPVALGIVALLATLATPALAQGGPVALEVYPPSMSLSGKDSAQRLMVIARYANGSRKDVTKQAKYSGGKTILFRVTGNEVIASIDGEGVVTVSYGGKTGQAKVTVQDTTVRREWSFANDIVPIFTKHGCNTGGCHGSPAGRGGFHLSLFGYEPDYDYDQIVKDEDGKRVNLKQVDKSLILLKPSMQVPHGGGPRFKKGDSDYNLIRKWLLAGAPQKPDFDRRVKNIKVYPENWMFQKEGDEQPLMVIAHFDDDVTRDVTEFSRYYTYDDQVAYVDADGILSAEGKGETTINIRFLSGIGVVRVQVPRDPLPATAFDSFKPVNQIDNLVLQKLKQARVAPSPLADDA